MMYKVSPEIRKKILALSHPSPWRFVLAATSDWCVIACAIALSLYAANIWTYFLAIALIATRQHAMMILCHDAAHYRAHRKHSINDALSDFLCAYPIFFDTSIYRQNHFAHHEHLNTAQDPDWARKYKMSEWTFPQSQLRLTAFFFQYVFLFQGTHEWLRNSWFLSGFSAPFRLSLVRKARKATFWLTLGSLLYFTGTGGYFLAYWIAPFFLVFPLLQRIRSLAEHFALSYESDLKSSRDITPSKLEGFLMAPHGVNFHLCHHLFPSVPFFRLKELHGLLMEDLEYASNSQQNSSYFWPSSQSLWKDLTSGHSPTKSLPQSRSESDPRQKPRIDAA